MTIAGNGKSMAAEPEVDDLVTGQSVGSGSLAPTQPGVGLQQAVVSQSQHEDLLNRLLALRKKMTAEAQVEVGVANISNVAPPATNISGMVSKAPGTLTIGRNKKNTKAEGANASTLAEPAAVNNKKKIFSAGNFNHAEFSTNGGTAWTSITLPGGFSDAPILCCDHDVVQDRPSGIAFHSAIYINSSLTNGVVRIFVRPNLASTSEACSYIIDPAGTSDNILPDFPHIALTKDYLYLTVNAIPTSTTGFARIYRFQLAPMRQCQTTFFNTFDQSFSTFGQRVWVPAEGQYIRTVMYWVQHDNASTMRVFKWDQANPAPSQTTHALQTTAFSTPDCRGGVGNFDFDDVTIVGFTHRSVIARGTNNPTPVLATYWNSAPIGGIPQGHIRSAVFQIGPTPTLIAQPHIFNSGFCFGFPAVTSNALGDIGITLAFGGKSGGGGSAVTGGVGIDDPFTPGIGFFQTVVPTASGVANRSDGRYGDYFTIHPHVSCANWFAATNYAWDSSPVDAANDVNSRYVEFGREKFLACYKAGGGP